MQNCGVGPRPSVPQPRRPQHQRVRLRKPSESSPRPRKHNAVSEATGADPAPPRALGRLRVALRRLQAAQAPPPYGRGGLATGNGSADRCWGPRAALARLRCAGASLGRAGPAGLTPRRWGCTRDSAPSRSLSRVSLTARSHSCAPCLLPPAPPCPDSGKRRVVPGARWPCPPSLGEASSDLCTCVSELGRLSPVTLQSWAGAPAPSKHHALVGRKAGGMTLRWLRTWFILDGQGGDISLCTGGGIPAELRISRSWEVLWARSHSLLQQKRCLPHAGLRLSDIFWKIFA